MKELRRPLTEEREPARERQVPGAQLRRREAHHLLVQRAVVEVGNPDRERPQADEVPADRRGNDRPRPPRSGPAPAVTRAGGRTANRAIADARAGQASAAVTGSAGARVARLPVPRARVGVRRDGAAGQVEGALACVVAALARADNLRAVRAHENLHRWPRTSAPGPGAQFTGPLAAAGPVAM